MWCAASTYPLQTERNTGSKEARPKWCLTCKEGSKTVGPNEQKETLHSFPEIKTHQLSTNGMPHSLKKTKTIMLDANGCKHFVKLPVSDIVHTHNLSVTFEWHGSFLQEVFDGGTNVIWVLQISDSAQMLWKSWKYLIDVLMSVTRS